MSSIVVVSKYKENIDWIEKINHPVSIYDKSESPIYNSIHRPNIGREAETLLYYIITNYTCLPNLTVFLQGDPRSNPIKYTYEQVVEEVNNVKGDNLQPILTWEGKCYFQNYWLKSCEILNTILFDNNPVIKYASGSQYVIPKSNILNRPLSFYITLHMLMSKYGNKSLNSNKSDLRDGIDAWTLEVMWGKIFDKTVALKHDWETNLFKLL